MINNETLFLFIDHKHGAPIFIGYTVFFDPDSRYGKNAILGFSDALVDDRDHLAPTLCDVVHRFLFTERHRTGAPVSSLNLIRRLPRRRLLRLVLLLRFWV